MNEQPKKLRTIPPDTIRAKALISSAQQALTTVNTIPLTEPHSKTIFRETYEALRLFISGIAYSKGIKCETHQDITTFLKEILKEEKKAAQFDRWRLLRNDLNYRRKDLAIETVHDLREEAPKFMKDLEKHLEIS